MAELTFYLCMRERKLFFEFCFENGFYLIPDIHYANRRYVIIRNANDFSEYELCVQFFILHDAYSKFPLEFGTFRKNGEDFYFVYQRYGGPTIDFGSPILAEAKYGKVGPGSISIYPFYYNDREKNYSLENLRQSYSLLIKFIKKICIKKNIHSKNSFIGKETIRLINENKLQVT